jgi:hypothetical protein
MRAAPTAAKAVGAATCRQCEAGTPPRAGVENCVTRAGPPLADTLLLP